MLWFKGAFLVLRLNREKAHGGALSSRRRLGRAGSWSSDLGLLGPIGRASELGWRSVARPCRRGGTVEIRCLRVDTGRLGRAKREGALCQRERAEEEARPTLPEHQPAASSAFRTRGSPPAFRLNLTSSLMTRMARTLSQNPESRCRVCVPYLGLLGLRVVLTRSSRRGRVPASRFWSRPVRVVVKVSDSNNSNDHRSGSSFRIQGHRQQHAVLMFSGFAKGPKEPRAGASS